MGLTGLGGVKALRSRSWIKDRGAGFSSGVPPARPWVEGNVWGCSGLGVKAEELMVLLGLGSSSTLQLATWFSGKINLPVNCCFASTLDR